MGKFFTNYKGRSNPTGRRVQVYRNLNKPGVTYSIRDASTKLVLGHAENVILNSCTFYVSQAGRERVLNTKRKNIHAHIEGYYGVLHLGYDKLFTETGTPVRYNPYTNDSFVLEGNKPISKAGVVYINQNGVYASGF